VGANPTLNVRHVKGVKLLFLPSADLKRNLEGLTFEVPPETPPTRHLDKRGGFAYTAKQVV
jgi:hypothetical protein